MARNVVTTKRLLKVEGVQELITAIEQYVNQTTGIYLKSIYFKAATVVSEQARLNIDAMQVDDRLKLVLKHSVFTSEGPAHHPNAFSALSQWRAAKKLGGKASGRRYVNPYWWEFGTAERHTAGGKYTGKISPQPFFRPAITQSRDKVVAVLVDGLAELHKRVIKEIDNGKSPRRSFIGQRFD